MTQKPPLPVVGSKTSTRWSQDRRLEFIDFRLRWDGRINRGDITAFFGISVPQASLDIARYLELVPDNLTYDRSGRIYLAGPGFKPVFARSNSSQYLNELLATQTGVLEPESSFIGWQPPVALVPTPGRVLKAETLAALLQAMRESQGVTVLYQSMTQAAPQPRTISPHAFAYDGFRWHVRAYCHLRKQFRDFVIARILQIELTEGAGSAPVEDHEWQTNVELLLAPNPKLSAPHKRAIELDYGMTHGQVRIVCRQALLFYILRHLGLDQDSRERPEGHQIILKNRKVVESYLQPKKLTLPVRGSPNSRVRG